MPVTPLTFTLLAPAKAYDGTTGYASIVEPVNSFFGIDTIDPDPGAADLEFSFAGGAFAQADAGVDIAVSSPSVIIGGTDAADFSVAAVIVPNGMIVALPIDVTADDKTKMRTANDPELTYVVSTAVGGYEGVAADAVFTGAPARDAGETVGDYDITEGTLATSANYDVTFVEAVLSIFALASGICEVETEPLRYRFKRGDCVRWSRWKRKDRENYGS